MSQPIRIIVGLGNPGREYQATRHNVGFMVLDRLADKLGAAWKLEKSYKAQLANGGGVLLVKPQTYMNDSGSSVGPLMRYFKFAPEQVLVIYDEVAFTLGTLKLRTGGSAGGHNGVKSLISHLGSEHFIRMRLGIGAPGLKGMTSHVLGNFAPDEKELLESTVEKSVAAALMALREGVQSAANTYNTKKEKKPREKKAAATPEPQEPASDSDAPSTPPA